MMEFASLVLGHPRKVQRRMEEGIWEYSLEGTIEDGVYIFETKGFTARPLRKADLEDRDQAMQGLPIVNALTSMWNPDSQTWFCHPLNINQTNKYPTLHFPAPLLLHPQELSILQPIEAWIAYAYGRRVLVFRELNLRYPIERLDNARLLLTGSALELYGTSHILRSSTAGLTSEERMAFDFAVKSTKPPIERLITESLNFVGAILLSYTDVGNGQYEVNYEYKGEQDRVIVNQKMTVVNAGICLVDRHGRHYAGHVDYDLGSIVLVKYRRSPGRRIEREEEDEEEEEE